MNEILIHSEFLSKIHGKTLFNESLQNHTSLRIGGPAKILVIPKDLNDVKYCIEYANRTNLRIYVIGNGSKLLFSDQGFNGLIIKVCGSLNEVSILDCTVTVGAGCSLSKLLQKATEKGLTGLEFTAGIPGTVGGAVVMNAGTSLGSMGNIVKMVTALDIRTGNLLFLKDKDCGFAYRKSIFQQKPLIVLSAELTLSQGDSCNMRLKVNEIMAKRKASHPLSKPNAGSTFLNPAGNSAAKLIDSIGLKNAEHGGAQISGKHANFIVNNGNATSRDICALIKLIQKRVYEVYNIDLEPELKMIE